MGISLPNPRNVFLPEPPPITTRNIDAIIRYLNKLKLALQKEYANAFDNTYSILSTGTSGSFVASNGDTVTVTNGVVTALS